MPGPRKRKAGDYSTFDVMAYLESKGIPYRTRGKNIKQGWIGVQSIFWPDHDYHLGINLQSKACSCWLSGKKGTALFLVREIENCSWAEAHAVIDAFSIKGSLREANPSAVIAAVRNAVTSVKLPAGSQPLLPSGINYLKRRGFDPDFLVEKYGLLQTGPLGAYKHRLIAPLYMEHILVNYTGRDLTGRQDPKYKHGDNEKVLLPMRSCIYNLDTVTDRILVVEGITDVWRFGDECAAIMSKVWTPEQLEILLHKNIKRAGICLDPDAKKAAEELGHSISSFIPEIKIIELDGCDPAELTDAEADEIKWQALYE